MIQGCIEYLYKVLIKTISLSKSSLTNTVKEIIIKYRVKYRKTIIKYRDIEVKYYNFI